MGDPNDVNFGGKDLYGVNFQNHHGKILTGRLVWGPAALASVQRFSGTARRALLAGVAHVARVELRAVAVGVDGKIPLRG